MVGLLWRVISPSQGCYLHTGQHKHRINAHTDIHALNMIRIHDPSIQASEDSSCLRPRGHCVRRSRVIPTEIKNYLFCVATMHTVSCNGNMRQTRGIQHHPWKKTAQGKGRIRGTNHSTGTPLHINIALLVATSGMVLSLAFLVSWGGVRLSPFGTLVTNWPIVPAPDDRWWRMWSRRWNDNWQKTCPSATLSTTNPTWLDLGSNPGHRGGSVLQVVRYCDVLVTRQRVCTTDNCNSSMYLHTPQSLYCSTHQVFYVIRRC
jgi:hypothetical protein